MSDRIAELHEQHRPYGLSTAGAVGRSTLTAIGPLT